MREAYSGQDERNRDAVYMRSHAYFEYSNPDALLALAEQKEDHVRAAGLHGELAEVMMAEVDSLVGEAAALEKRRNKEVLMHQDYLK